MIAKLLSAAGVASVGTLAIAASLHVSAAPVMASPQGTASASDSAARCAKLAGKQVAGATVDKADFVTNDTALPPFNDKIGFEFCRVDAHISPVAGSEIKMQIWLPATWNGKFVGVGGGGFEGGYASAPLGLRGPVGNGYAAVATNAGHAPSPEPKWAVGNPEKLADYGHRANHLGAMVGKALVADYYGTPAKRAYFHGCSNGGRDALMLAQRYPGDYDAIAVGAPANDFTGLMASFARISQLARMPGVDLAAAKMKLVHEAAIGTCDMLDGVKDGLLERPTECRFDPAVLQCKSGEGGSCLSEAEVSVIKAIYRGTHAGDGREIMAGLPVGSEYEWAGWLTTPRSAASGFAAGFFPYMVHQDPSWDIANFDLERDHALARKRLGPVIDAVDPDLRPFLRKGGKLLIYHGWDDAAIPAGNTLRYWQAMQRAVGRRAADQTRLFMLPGVAHCAGGNGPGTVDYIAELDRWSEKGVAPERIVATKPESIYRAMGGLATKSLLSRPVCAWPKTARYRGKGSTDEAENFVCR